MFMEYFMKSLEKARKLMFEPEKAFRAEQKTSMGEAFKYMLTIGSVFVVLISLVGGILTGSPIFFVTSLVVMYFIIALGSVICSLVLHLFAYIFGAKQGLEQTMKVVFYSMTPMLLLGWIPLIGVVFGLWGIVLEVVGLSVLQKMTTGRAVLVVLFPVILALGIILVAALFALTVFIPAAYVGTTGLPTGAFDGATWIQP
jgi:hypothetical protein